MKRTPEACPHRSEQASADGAGGVCCELVAGILGSDRAPQFPPGPAACEACCCQRPPSRRAVNPVVASLVYSEATATVQSGSASAWQIAEALRSRQYVTDRLESLLAQAEQPRASGGDGSHATVAGPCPASRPSRPGPARVGLVGWNTATGLGYQNRDLAVRLPVDKWLVPIHPRFPTLARPRGRCRIEYVSRGIGADRLRAWLEGLDWVLFVELPQVRQLAAEARRMGARVACVPNWEYTDVTLDWLDCIDLMICPTRHTYERIADWRRRFGFAWEVIHVPWPVDVRRFRFRRRTKCRRFLFVNGTGGSRARRQDGSLSDDRRKGAEVVCRAARLLPHIPFTVYSQIDDLPRMPPNVELRRAAARNSRLYRRGDVCVQPSRWEGLGLQFLECQAAGMPLVTTDAPPMNEYRPLAAVPARYSEVVSVFREHPIVDCNIEAEDLAGVLERIYETDVAEASENARRFVVQEHGWDRAARLLREKLVRQGAAPAAGRNR